MNKIYVAYSWIGPTGPLSNNQVPTILTLADNYNETNIISDKNDREDTWERIFSQGPDLYSLKPSATLEQNDIFVFPFKLNVRTPLSSYFSYNNGLLEYSFTGGDVNAKVREFNGYFVFDFRDEASVSEQFFSAIHSYFKMHGMLAYKVIFLTGAINVVELYEKFCSKHNFTPGEQSRIKFIPCPDYEPFNKQICHKTIHTFTEPEYNIEVVPSKFFLCWNRRFRKHRITLCLAMEKSKLIEKSYLSLARKDAAFDKDITEFIHDIPPEMNIDENTKNELIKRLPLILDEESNVSEMCTDSLYKTRPFYSDSLVSIVTETNFDLPILTSTEKTFKPMREKHPFILVASSGALKALKSIGFKTFDKFWDESYDDITNHNQRMHKIIEILNYIASWDRDKILDFKKQAKEIVEHNYNQLKISPVRRILNEIYGHIVSTTQIK